MAEHSKLSSWLSTHPVCTFVLMTSSFLGFGILSLDLAKVILANAEYISANGWAGLIDGGLQQLFELIRNAIAAMMFYLLFKLCEHVLVEKLANQNLKSRQE
ncbi:hypothetical protein ACO0K0_14410 [Undibacterium sp. SXout11W]|uniref:hypothetical protein n=1 Tax=Undibacterium sp. SXout11W TaxID=3413050 RepID=UPI003BF2D5AA